MKEYFGTLLCVACVCGIAEMLSPSGKKEGLRRQVRFICAISIVCVVASPIGSILAKVKNESFDMSFLYDRELKESEYESVFKEYVEGQSASAVGECLESELCEKFEISTDDIAVSVALLSDNNVTRIDRITVYIGAGAIAKDPHLIIDHIRSRTNIECEIIYKKNTEK